MQDFKKSDFDLRVPYSFQERQIKKSYFESIFCLPFL